LVHTKFEEKFNFDDGPLRAATRWVRCHDGPIDRGISARTRRALLAAKLITQLIADIHLLPGAVDE
jgi:hypothetical protein